MNWFEWLVRRNKNSKKFDYNATKRNPIAQHEDKTVVQQDNSFLQILSPFRQIFDGKARNTLKKPKQLHKPSTATSNSETTRKYQRDPDPNEMSKFLSLKKVLRSMPQQQLQHECLERKVARKKRISSPIRTGAICRENIPAKKTPYQNSLPSTSRIQKLEIQEISQKIMNSSVEKVKRKKHPLPKDPLMEFKTTVQFDGCSRVFPVYQPTVIFSLDNEDVMSDFELEEDMGGDESKTTALQLKRCQHNILKNLKRTMLFFQEEVIRYSRFHLLLTNYYRILSVFQSLKELRNIKGGCRSHWMSKIDYCNELTIVCITYHTTYTYFRIHCVT
jgi:hypothetical protein